MPTTPLGIPTPSDSVKISGLAEAQRQGFGAVDSLLSGGLTPELTDEARRVAQQEAELAVTEQLENSGLVSAVTIDLDRVELNTEEGETVLAVEDIYGSPYFTGSPTVITEPIAGDSVEWVDDNGVTILAIDGIKSSPYFRGNYGQETHFILALGQSNSYGIGEPIAANTNNTLHNLYTVPQAGAQQGKEVIAKDPLTHPYDTPRQGTIGHAFTFARNYALQNPDVKVVIIPLAKSGAGFFYSAPASYTWAPSRSGEGGMINLYNQAIARATEAIDSYSGAKRVAAMVWHQGESDAVGETTQAEYEQELELLIDGLRASIPGAAGAPLIIGQLGWEFRNIRQPGTWAQIDAAHQNMPNLVAGTSFAPAPGQGYMMPDNTHFTAYGQKLLAASMVEQLQPAQYNI